MVLGPKLRPRDGIRSLRGCPIGFFDLWWAYLSYSRYLLHATRDAERAVRRGRSAARDAERAADLAEDQVQETSALAPEAEALAVAIGGLPRGRYREFNGDPRQRHRLPVVAKAVVDTYPPDAYSHEEDHPGRSSSNHRDLRPVAHTYQGVEQAASIASLAPAVQDAINDIFRLDGVRRVEMEPCCFYNLIDFAAPVALRIVQDFRNANANMSTLRDKTAFFCSIIERYRTGLGATTGHRRVVGGMATADPLWQQHLIPHGEAFDRGHILGRLRMQPVAPYATSSPPGVTAKAIERPRPSDRPCPVSNKQHSPSSVLEIQMINGYHHGGHPRHPRPMRSPEPNYGGYQRPPDPGNRNYYSLYGGLGDVVGFTPPLGESATAVSPLPQQQQHSSMAAHASRRTTASSPRTSRPSTWQQRDILEVAIRAQVEYYFSVTNPCKDVYMRTNCMDEDGYVSLTHIASFKRVCALTTDLQVLKEALMASKKLEFWHGATAGECKVRTNNQPERWPVSSRGHSTTATTRGS